MVEKLRPLPKSKPKPPPEQLLLEKSVKDLEVEIKKLKGEKGLGI